MTCKTTYSGCCLCLCVQRAHPALNSLTALLTKADAKPLPASPPGGIPTGEDSVEVLVARLAAALQGKPLIKPCTEVVHLHGSGDGTWTVHFNHGDVMVADKTLDAGHWQVTMRGHSCTARYFGFVVRAKVPGLDLKHAQTFQPHRVSTNGHTFGGAHAPNGVWVGFEYRITFEITTPCQVDILYDSIQGPLDMNGGDAEFYKLK
jgi:hypothetical protein